MGGVVFSAQCAGLQILHSWAGTVAGLQPLHSWHGYKNQSASDRNREALSKIGYTPNQFGYFIKLT
jgi:hypothetical protein